MENLIFALDATIPIFLMMLLGVFLRRVGLIDEAFAAKLNKFVFIVPLPALLFEDLSTVDFAEAWNTKFVLFCLAATALSITLASLAAMLLKNRAGRGEFIQASYRSSAALLGTAFIQNIYGTTGMAPLMIIASVPLYNIMAVTVLSFFSPEHGKTDAKVLKKTLIGIVTNPIIIAIAAGLVWSALKMPMPSIVRSAVSNIGKMATPMGLIAMGASFDIGKALGSARPAVCATVIKLIGFVSIFLPFAVLLGFRNEELVAILVMLGSATTVSCYVMAKNMGHDGNLTASVVMLTTMLAAFTLAAWLFLLKSLGLV